MIRLVAQPVSLLMEDGRGLRAVRRDETPILSTTPIAEPFHRLARASNPSQALTDSVSSPIGGSGLINSRWQGGFSEVVLIPISSSRNRFGSLPHASSRFPRRPRRGSCGYRPEAGSK